MAIYIFNHFIEDLLRKYNDKNIIDIKFLNTERETITKYDDIEFEMIRIKISCQIDELKNIFHGIKPKRDVIRCENDKNNAPVIVSSYVNFGHNDTFRMSVLFPNEMDYHLIIEIYRENFTKFMRNDETEDGCIVFDLDHINFLS